MANYGMEGRLPRRASCHNVDQTAVFYRDRQAPQRRRRRGKPSVMLPVVGMLSLAFFAFSSNIPCGVAFSNQRVLPLSRPSKLLISSSFSHVPQTQTISQSIRTFVRYCFKLGKKDRHAKDQLAIQQKQQSLSSPTTSSSLEIADKHWRSEMKRWNQQRKYVVQLANYKSHIVLPSFTALAIGALLVSMIPHFEARCIQMVATLHARQSEVVYAILGLVVTNTLAAIFTGVRGALFWIAGSRANYNIRVKLHERLLYQEAAFFDSHETGSLLSRLNSDVNKIGQVISYHVNVVCRQLAQFLFGSIYLVRISPRLSLFAGFGILLVAILSNIYGKFNRDCAERVQDTFAKATIVAETSFRISETIRMLDGRQSQSRAYEKAQRKALDVEEVQAWGYGTHKFVSDALQGILHGGLLFLCWKLGRANGLAASQLTTFLFYTNFVLESSNEVGDQWAKIQGAVGASQSVFELLQRNPKLLDSGEMSVVPEAQVHAVNGGTTAAPVLSVQNVTLQYDAMEQPALQNVDLDFYPGDRVAIVGRSGSGKSSLLRSLLRFYDPTSGTVAYKGNDLTTLSRTQLASVLTMVPQEPALFPLTLLDNVLYGIPKENGGYDEALKKRAMKALIEAGLNVTEIPITTRIGDGGRTLSGGQRQRVAIARALVRQANVLILDEPTAALDSSTEQQVIHTLRELTERVNTSIESVVMVTHRLGVIESLGVNRVIVMDQGRIIESGHPDVLLTNSRGAFSRLAAEQGIAAKVERGKAL